ncbi:MAG: glycosyltransferase [Acetobacteraceae bacterium]|nr:glycosyltransferase [Acetobacteraceae bacterium]
MSRTPKLPETAKAAALCLDRAAQAAAQGETDRERDWLERAHRLLPNDPAIALRLGLFWLHRNPTGALPLFEQAAEQACTQEIWLGLATLRQGLARRAALDHLLTHCVLTVDRTVIDRLATEPWRGAVWNEDGGPRLIGPRRAKLGRRVDLARMLAVEGCVWEAEGGLAGWAWHPASPSHAPRLLVQDGAGHRREIAPDQDMQVIRPLSQPRGFQLSAEALAGWNRTIRVVDADGRDLPGSPVVRDALTRTPPPGQYVARPISADPTRNIAIVVPAYRDWRSTRACLAAVMATAPDARLIVVDDASPDSALSAGLDRLAAQGRIALRRHAHNLGFPASANAGLRMALALPERHDVVLLNADTLVPRGRGRSWLHRLRALVHSAPDIASATPFSNAASLLSYPQRDHDTPRPKARDVARLDAQANRANGEMTVDIPSGVGFCLYLRHEALLETGLLREDVFAQGYGEENEWCRRSLAVGWRHVAAAGVFVGHLGAASFGAAKAALMARNLRLLEALHPGYGTHVATWAGRVPAEDNLAVARRNLDIQRFFAPATRPTALLITHASGGGVERAVQMRAAAMAAQGCRALILRPMADPTDRDGATLPGWCVVQDATGSTAYPNLAFRLPEHQDALRLFLRRCQPRAAEVHHRLGHAPALLGILAEMKLPIAYAIHDYASVCPRMTFLGPELRYCGEPTDAATCHVCLASVGSRNLEALDVMALRARSAQEFAHATRIAVPCADMARRLRRYFPQIDPIVEPPDEPPLPVQPPPRRTREGGVVVAVVGAISIDKGFNVLRACAEDAAQRNLPLYFRLVGMSLDDEALIATGRIFVTGRYREAEARSLLREQQAHVAFLPSVVPESWSYALSHVWRAGLSAVVFDIGALAARVRQTGMGAILPLGLPAAMINEHLLKYGNP